MKVLLTAFNKKLIAEPIDWPDDKSGQDIYLPLDMEQLKVMTEQTGLYKGSFAVDHFERKRGRFQSIRKFQMLPGQKETAEIYVLVDIS